MIGCIFRRLYSLFPIIKEKLYSSYWSRKTSLCGSAGKESACNAGDLGSIPGLGRSPGEGKGYPLQYSGLENSMDGIVHGVAKSQTRLSNFHFTSHKTFNVSPGTGIRNG